MKKTFLKNGLLLWLALPLSFWLSCKEKASANGLPPPAAQDSVILQLADPTIFFHDGVYYLYGTGGDVGRGFTVYTSPDLQTWQGPKGATGGFALVEGDSYGDNGFWAPQVFYRNGKFYMAYTANEHIAIAQADSPLGPFKQTVIQAISGPGKQIDPYVFFDDDGKAYLYHVRLTEGNRVFVAELNSGLSDVVPGTERECLSAVDTWENTANAGWPVAEGPTVLKQKGVYYLFYSANDFRNIDYAVGYATSSSPLGPWKKYGQNPIISRASIGKNGTGHGDFVKDAGGQLVYVLHTHASSESVQPRLTGLVRGGFVPDGGGADKMVMEPRTFRYLYTRSR